MAFVPLLSFLGASGGGGGGGGGGLCFAVFAFIGYLLFHPGFTSLSTIFVILRWCVAGSPVLTFRVHPL